MERNENTRQLIMDTLLGLSYRVDIEKINVAMLVKECGISRTLFYYYYQDLYALLEDIINRDMEKVMTDCIRIDDPYGSVRYYILCCTGHFDLLKKVKGTRYYETAERMIGGLTEKYLYTVFEHKAGHAAIPVKDVRFFVEFMAAGITAYFFKHCDDPRFHVDEAAEQLFGMIRVFSER